MLLRASRISAKKQKELLKLFSLDVEAKKAAELVKVSRNTAYFYYTNFRELIFKHLSRAPRFSGEVEIDEASIGGYTPKKRPGADPENYAPHVGNKIIKKYKKPPKILLMGIQRRNGDLYVQVVADRSRETLVPVIHLVVEEGTTIYTDGWSSYNKLELSGYKHFKINHDKKYANRKGEHVATIDSFWRECLPKISRYRGGFRHNFPLHLKEQEFRWNYRREKMGILPTMKKLLQDSD